MVDAHTPRARARSCSQASSASASMRLTPRPSSCVWRRMGKGSVADSARRGSTGSGDGIASHRARLVLALGLPPVTVTVTAVDSTAVFFLPEALTGRDGRWDGRHGRLDG
ncbi:hypothetical protein DFH09DRAFT_1094515 [Mycena vulgaris]|nr:hypothetical protein DFH09DRAFT_1094515 [Mycena vulgaris]